MTIDKLGSMERLRAAGVWDQAVAFREEVRRRLKSEGKGRAEAVNLAWKAMCDLYGPLTEASQQTPSLEVVLGGAIDEILDPEYTEPDSRKRIRDSVLWAAEQFRRVVEDRPGYIPNRASSSGLRTFTHPSTRGLTRKDVRWSTD